MFSRQGDGERWCWGLWYDDNLLGSQLGMVYHVGFWICSILRMDGETPSCAEEHGVAPLVDFFGYVSPGKWVLQRPTGGRRALKKKVFGLGEWRLGSG